MKMICKHVGLSPYSEKFTGFKSFLENTGMISEEQLQLFIEFAEIKDCDCYFDDYVKVRIYEYGYTVIDLIDFVNSITYDDLNINLCPQITMYNDPYYTRGLSRNDFI